MIIIGLIILVVAAIFGADLAYHNNASTKDPTVFSHTVGVTHTRSLFVLGVIVGAALILGLALILSGLRHKSNKWSEGRNRQDRGREETARLRAERDTLRSHNEGLQERLVTGDTTPPDGDVVVGHAEPRHGRAARRARHR